MMCSDRLCSSFPVHGWLGATALIFINASQMLPRMVSFVGILAVALPLLPC